MCVSLCAHLLLLIRELLLNAIHCQPEVFKDTFGHLSSAFSEAISSIQHESGSGIGYVGKALIARLEKMRDEVDGWRIGKGLPEVEKHGGERGEDVEQAEGDEGGLYKD